MKLRNKMAVFLAVIIAIMTPVTAMADREDAILDKPYIALGADLNDTEKNTVLQLLGISESELSNYSLIEITNEMEHEYLDEYLDSSLIGSRALSSVVVEGKEDGYGIKVTTQNISYCTVGMYQNALATAGIKNADIKVVGPFSISGTAGLVGAIKAYETMTGQKVNTVSMETATNELVVTSDLAKNIQDPEKAEELVGFIKNEVASNDYSEEEIGELIDQAANEFDVNLSEEDKQKIQELMNKIDEMDLDIDQLQEQVEGLYNKLKDMDLKIDLNTEEAQNFLSGLLDKILEFFRNLFG